MEIFLTSFSDLKMVNGKPDTQEKTENRNQILNIYDFAIGRSILEIPT